MNWEIIRSMLKGWTSRYNWPKFMITITNLYTDDEIKCSFCGWTFHSSLLNWWFIHYLFYLPMFSICLKWYYLATRNTVISSILNLILLNLFNAKLESSTTKKIVQTNKFDWDQEIINHIRTRFACWSASVFICHLNKLNSIGNNPHLSSKFNDGETIDHGNSY